MDHTRDPCPWVVLNDFGGAFCMGVCTPSTLDMAPSSKRTTAEDRGAPSLIR
jgi:hypothetical protein